MPDYRKKQRGEREASTVNEAIIIAGDIGYPVTIRVLVPAAKKDYLPGIACSNAVVLLDFLKYWKFRNLFDRAFISRHRPKTAN